MWQVVMSPWPTRGSGRERAGWGGRCAEGRGALAGTRLRGEAPWSRRGPWGARLPAVAGPRPGPGWGASGESCAGHARGWPCLAGMHAGVGTLGGTAGHVCVGDLPGDGDCGLSEQGREVSALREARCGCPGSAEERRRRRHALERMLWQWGGAGWGLVLAPSLLLAMAMRDKQRG